MQAKSIILTLVFAVLIPGSLSAQSKSTEARSKEAAIRELLEVTGSGKLGVQIVNQMISNFKQGSPNVGDKFWDKFSSKIDPNEMVELVIPIYEKHFSAVEIEEVLAFYKTTTGKKVISVMPLVLTESMAAGQQWGRKIAEMAVKELEAEQASNEQAKPKH